RCERCLEEFNFPTASPPKDPWVYRTQGAFSVENYAAGGYAVLFALRCLVQGLSGEATWATGIEIEVQKGRPKDEADFVLWWRQSFGDSTEPRLIMGEAKSNGTFGIKDIRRAKRLGTRFPGTILAFATLRERLETEEKRRLADLAVWGRGVPAGSQRNP